MITKSYGFNPETATLVTGFQPYLLSAADVVMKSETPTSVTAETSLSGEYMSSEKWTWGNTAIKNIYKGTDIPVAQQPASVSGVQLFLRRDGEVRIESTEDLDFLKRCPIPAWLCLKVPINQYITAQDVYIAIKRLCGSVVSDPEGTTARIDQLMRGALKPTT
jgi:hypothetical protein